MARAQVDAARLLGSRGAFVELLHVGSAIPRKRLDFLLTVFADVRACHANVRLTRAGGSFTAEQSSLARRLNVLDAVVVLPRLDRETLAAVYRRSTLLLMTSEREGFGLPVLEALACGTPVVCSDIPPHRFIVGNHAVAWLVGNAMPCANALVAAQGRRNQQTRSDVRRWFDAHLSWPAIAQQMQSAYQSLSSLPHYA